MDGRPRPQPVIKFCSCLLPRELVNVRTLTGNRKDEAFAHPSYDHARSFSPETTVTTEVPFSLTPPLVKAPLITLCYGRSGDKGDSSNIGLICRSPMFYSYIKQHITAEVVCDYMKHIVKGKVVRYELPGSHAFNFILTRSLGGGGVSSLQMDRQGKTHAQILLTYRVSIPQEWLKVYESRLASL